MSKPSRLPRQTAKQAQASEQRHNYKGENADQHSDFFSEAIGKTRFIVIISVVAVLLVAFSLFLQGTLVALWTVYDSWKDMFNNGVLAQKGQLAVSFLELVSTMFKAVVFYIIGLGLYSLFIRPLNITNSLGIRNLADLENKIISVVIVILGITFLEHFVHWKNPQETLIFAAAFALASVAITWFQKVNEAGCEPQEPEVKMHARRELFEKEQEQGEIDEEKVRRAEEITEARIKEQEGGGENAAREEQES